MPNPSTAQVIEPREQMTLAHDVGGMSRDRIWALEEGVAILVSRDLHLDTNQM